MARALVVLVLVVVGLAVLAHRSGTRPALDQVAIGRRALGIELRAAMVPVGDVRLYVVEAGPPDGRPVLLLHGFPEFWWAWNAQMVRLAAAGFRVIVPDQRGYDVSEKPDGVAAYRTSILTADVIGLLDALRIPAVNLAGHDWGGAIAWRVVLQHPDRVRRLVMFNAPHPWAWKEAAEHPEPGESIAWFRFFFQLPWIPEIATRARDWRALSRSLVDTSRPGTFVDQELDYYKAAWARDGAMSSMVNWYRASFRYFEPIAGDGMVQVPTRIVWGMQDRFFERRMATLSAAHCAVGELITLDDAGHWLLHEEPEITSRHMIDFFGTS